MVARILVRLTTTGIVCAVAVMLGLPFLLTLFVVFIPR
jgi:hypothetical protein